MGVFKELSLLLARFPGKERVKGLVITESPRALTLTAISSPASSAKTPLGAKVKGPGGATLVRAAQRQGREALQRLVPCERGA